MRLWRKKTSVYDTLKNGDAKSCGCRRTPSIPFKSRISEGVNVDDKSGCWNWKGNINNSGYGSVSVSKGSRDKKVTMRTHRMSWIAFNGDIPAGMHVLHKCDNRTCVNPEHLFLGTHRDNMQDMMQKGRHASQKRGLASQPDTEKKL